MTKRLKIKRDGPLPPVLVWSAFSLGLVAAALVPFANGFLQNVLADLLMVGLSTPLVNYAVPWIRAREHWRKARPLLDDCLRQIVALIAEAGEWYQLLVIAATAGTSHDPARLRLALSNWREAVTAAAVMDMLVVPAALPPLPVFDDLDFFGPVHYARTQRQAGASFDPADLMEPHRWMSYNHWMFVRTDRLSHAVERLLDMQQGGESAEAWATFQTARWNWDSYCLHLDAWLRSPERRGDLAMDVLKSVTTERRGSAFADRAVALVRSANKLAEALVAENTTGRDGVDSVVLWSAFHGLFEHLSHLDNIREPEGTAINEIEREMGERLLREAALRKARAEQASATVASKLESPSSSRAETDEGQAD